MFQTNPGGVKLFSYLNTFFCSNKLCIAVATLKTLHRAFSFTSPAAMQIYWNKRNFLSKKKVQSLENWFETPTFAPFRCFGTSICRT